MTSPATASSGLTTPLSATATKDILDRFYRDGCVLVPGVLGTDECAKLRAITDDIAKVDPAWVIREPEEKNLAYVELFIREPILSLVRAILGPAARFCATNVIRNQPGQSISHWHVDDIVEYPLPPEVPHWPAPLPLMWLSVQVALSDILAQEDGPTEIVPGSQLSGRDSPKENPVFEGKTATPMFCRAGDIYLFNHQVWHRGSPNTGKRTRYLMQLQYARGDNPAFRMRGAIRTPGLERILANADPALREFMYAEVKYR